MKQENTWKLRGANEINLALKDMPLAFETKLIRKDIQKELNGRKAIIVNEEVVNIPTDKYKLVQHYDAFRPVVEGLVLAGVENFSFSSWFTNKRANLAIFVDEALDGVKFGFNINNSFDSGSALNFGFSSYQRKRYIELVEKEHVTLWGYREVCSNGMKIKIPLKSIKYVDAVTREKVNTLISGKRHIIHTGKIEEKIKDLQYAVEAVMLLKEPLNQMICDAMNFKVTNEIADEIIRKYVGQRNIDKYLQNFEETAGNDLWSLYNSMTWLASHAEDISIKRKENIMEKASVMLVEVLTKEVI